MESKSVELGPDPVELGSDEGVIRCPAIRSLIKDGKLKHEGLKTAGVQDLVGALSGGGSDLGPTEAGSLANVAGFFAIFNHGRPVGRGLWHGIRGWFHKPRDIKHAAEVAAGQSTSRLFHLRLFQSPGDHPGTVNFFKDDDRGEFQVEQFACVMAQVSDGETLTIQGIAKMIIMANDGRWDRKKGSPLDLAKSAGEWALMVCALRANQATTDISVAHLRQMYSDADSKQLLIGTQCATARDWVKVSAQIAAAIAAEKGQALRTLASDLHSAFRNINAESGEKLCPCKGCNPEIWEAIESEEKVKKLG